MGIIKISLNLKVKQLFNNYENHNSFFTNFFVFLPFLANTQVQIGSDIHGLENEWFGDEISISDDGNILALIGGFNARDNRVNIFNFSNGDWQPYGIDVEGIHYGGQNAYGITLSGDGKTFATGGEGIVRIYNYTSGDWIPKGSTLSTTAISVIGLSLSSDGNIIAIGSPNYSPPLSRGLVPPEPPSVGIVQVFKYESGNWNQIGGDIVGIVYGEDSGRSVSLSDDGNIIGITNQNSVRIYENVSGTWTILGDEIPSWDSRSISLSSNGEVIAIGEHWYSEISIQGGRARIFSYSMGEWSQIGQNIIASEDNYRTGRSISLSSNGNVVVVGEIGFVINSTDKGRCRIFENQSGTWIPIGTDTYGENPEDYWGFSVSLTGDATTVAISSAHSDSYGENAGLVRVYDLNSLLATNTLDLKGIKIFPNPTSAMLEVSLPEGIELKRINIFNNLGQFINSTEKEIVNISDLSTGPYYIEIITKNGKATKKIVVK